MARRRRSTPGVVPRIGQALWRGARWGVGHPQPLVVGGLFVAVGLLLSGFVTRSEAFRVTRVEVSPENALSVPESSLLGRNLWTIDLRALAGRLAAQAPQLKQVRVVRLLPNTLRIEAITRVPVAQLRLGGWHAVDRDGFIFPQSSPSPAEDLVILKGAEHQKAPLKTGQEHASERLDDALQLTQRLTNAPVLAGHRLRQVDVADPKQLVFVMDDDVEIRCGSEEEMAAHLQRLGAVLQRVAKAPLPIRYIDVRFKDPVIGPRTQP